MFRVGLVGYGGMGRMHAQCWAATGAARVVAVADVEPARREEAGRKLGAVACRTTEDLLASAVVDIVDVCTPTFLHESDVIAAAGAGRAILCEKPMSLTVEACDRMIGAVARAGVALMIGQVIRFWPEYRTIKDLVDSGRYGAVQWASAQRRSGAISGAWQDWFFDPERSGGAVLDLAIHDQDFLRWLIGPPATIDAHGTPGRRGGIDSVQALGGGHRGGATSCVEASFDLARSFPFAMSLLVACERATIRYDQAARPTLVVYPFEGEAFAPELPRLPVGSSTEYTGNISDLGGYYSEIRYFLDCLQAGRKPEIVTPEDAREAVRICLAVERSVRSGGRVSVSRATTAIGSAAGVSG